MKFSLPRREPKGSDLVKTPLTRGLSGDGLKLGVQVPSRESCVLLPVSAEFQRKLIGQAEKEHRSLDELSRDRLDQALVTARIRGIPTRCKSGLGEVDGGTVETLRKREVQVLCTK